MSLPRARGIRLADAGGVVGAILAALCCAGTPLIVSGLAAAGLSAFRSDAILWPLMLLSLLVALWGFWQGLRLNRHPGPLAAALAGGTALVAGVIFVHGFPAMQLIWGGAVVLVAATLWNIRQRAACARRT